MPFFNLLARIIKGFHIACFLFSVWGTAATRMPLSQTAVFVRGQRKSFSFSGVHFGVKAAQLVTRPRPSFLKRATLAPRGRSIYR